MIRELWIAGQILLLALGDILVALWNFLIEWIEDILYQWLTVYEPMLSALVKEALVVLDRVTVPIRRAAKKAWNELRRYLLKQLVDIFELEDGSWANRIVSWLLLPRERVVRKVIEDRIVNWVELPDDIRAELIRRGQVDQLDVTKTRDREVETLVA